MQKQVDSLSELYSDAVKSKQETDFAYRQILDKTVTMLGTKDPLAYQQVMAMQQPADSQVMTVYGSSDYDEWMKEQLMNNDPGAQYDEEIDDPLLREIGVIN